MADAASLAAVRQYPLVVARGGGPPAGGLRAPSAAALLGALLRGARAAAVLVPGLVIGHPGLLAGLALDVRGYDVEPRTMAVDLASLRGRLTGGGGPVVVVLAGCRGRFPANAREAADLARRRGALVVEVRLPTMRASPEDADVVMTSFDGPGFRGGAVAYAARPDLAAAIRANLESPPDDDDNDAGAARKLEEVLRRVGLSMMSNRLDYGYMLSVITSFFMVGGLARRLVGAVRPNSGDERGKKSNNPVEAARARAIDVLYDAVVSRKETKPRPPTLPSLFTAPTWPTKYRIRWPPGLSFEGILKPLKGSGGKAHHEPYRPGWVPKVMAAQSQRRDAEALSLWSFLFFLPSYITVISAGEPDDPEACVEAAASDIVLRAEDPAQVVRRLHLEGFAAIQARAIPYRNPPTPNGETDAVARDRIPAEAYRLHRVQDVVYFADCPKSCEAAGKLIFVPLATHMSASAHAHLLDVLADMPRRWWCGEAPPPPPRGRPYDTPAVRSLLNGIIDRHARRTLARSQEGAERRTWRSVVPWARDPQDCKAVDAPHVRDPPSSMTGEKSKLVDNDPRLSDIRASEDVLYKEYPPLFMYLLYGTQIMWLLASML